MYEPFPKQIEFHKATAPNFLTIGSRGSGKTKALRYDAHMRALSVPGCNLILIRKTFPDLLKTHIQDLKMEMPLLGGTYHETNHIAYYPNGSKLHLSYVGTAVDGMNLLSAEYLGAYFDEISTIPWEFFIKLSASVRVSKSSGIGDGHVAVVRAATNPLGPSAGDVQKYFVDKNVDPEDDQEYNPADWGSLQINMEDNPYLDVDQYKKRFAGMPEHVRKAWLEGEFSNESALFNFQPKKDGKPWHVIPYIDPTLLKKATIYRAYDHGYSPDPAYCLWIAHIGNRFIAFKEQVWYRTVVEQIAADIKEMQARLGIERVITTYCDPTISIQTGADIRTIRDKFEDFGIPMECSINNRELYSSAMHSALSEEVDGFPKLQIYQNGRDQGCPYLVKTLPMMQYNPKRPQALADHKDDHATIAACYFLISNSSMDRGRSYSSPIIRPWQRTKSTDRMTLGRESVRERPSSY